MRTSNPVLNKKTFNSANSVDLSRGVMTLEGTVNKSIVLFTLLLTGAVFIWSQLANRTLNINYSQIVFFSGILGLAIALVTVFKKDWSPVTAPIYAAIKGVFVGSISLVFQLQFPGIVIQAVGLTMATFFGILIIYKSKLIQVNEKFKLGVIGATGALALVYLVSFLLSFLGIRLPLIHESGLIGILFSLFAVVIASLNLVLDFDFIEQASLEGQSPKYMEWYASFGLIVTLAWLYVEILRLLAKLSLRRD